MTRSPDPASIDYARCRRALVTHFQTLDARGAEAFRLRLRSELTRLGADVVADLRGAELYDLLDTLGLTGPGTPVVRAEPRADPMSGMISGRPDPEDGEES